MDRPSEDLTRAARVAIQEVRLILGTAARDGVASGPLLAGELSRDLLGDPDAHVSQPAFERLLERAIRPSRNPNLGLHAGELTGSVVRVPDALHYALMTCTTLGEQLRLICRYVGFVNANADLALPGGDAVPVRPRVLAALARAARRAVGGCG